MPNVLNKHQFKNSPLPQNAIYIGRPSKWGNPFQLDPKKKGKDRDSVLAQYREYLMTHPELVELAKKELKGKDLVCWCAPKLCHGDVLLEIANVE